MLGEHPIWPDNFWVDKKNNKKIPRQQLAGLQQLHPQLKHCLKNLIKNKSS
jgi:hypothetical protein